jgi:hypothetical protein
MGRPIKIAKSDTIDTGYENGLGLGIVGGNSTITGQQVKVRMKLNGTEADGWILRQRSPRKFTVSDGTNTGDCYLVNKANGSLNDQEMTITATKSDASRVRLSKVGDTNGVDFDGNAYLLSFNSSSATAPAGSWLTIVQVDSV